MELYLRMVAQILGRIRELDPAPLTLAREPAQRLEPIRKPPESPCFQGENGVLVGNCRDHAVLCVALLRQQGVPARRKRWVILVTDGANVHRPEGSKQVAAVLKRLDDG